MLRRNSIIFLIIMALVLPMISVADNKQASKAKAATAVEAFSREKINFNREWKFARQDIENAYDINYNDSKWYNVGLPHDFSIPYWQEEKHYTGYGWYRKKFEIKQEWIGKNITLDFAGVFHTAEVYINGKYVDMHEGGYTGFEIDITDYVQAGDNTVAIRVNNLWKATLAPRAGEHMFTGGIYRDVNLVITSPIHVAWYGTFVQTPDLDTTHSKVRVLTEIANDGKKEQTVNVVNTVYDSSDNVVKTIKSKPVSIKAGTTHEFDDTSDYINNPKLWSPEHPNMYKVHTDVYVDDVNVDQYDTPFGFRWYKFDADKGFFLNGEHYWIDGTNAHQDHAGWANAVTTDALFRDVAMIKEAGLNFIRGSHYPHSPAYGDACDQYGLLFWSEAPFWCTSAWGEGNKTGTSDDYKVDGYPTTGNKATEEAFEQSCIDTLSEMIRINRNHPSIVVWSMGNEPFFGDNANKKKALISKMAGVAKKLDPTRTTAIGGTQRGAFDHLPNVDMAGYNGDGAEMPEYQNPGVANMVSEYSTHTGNRPEQYRSYYGSVQTDEDGNPIRYPWRSGVALWCSFHHGSILSRSYGDMGFIDYYRLPLNIWYYYRKTRTGVEPKFSKEGTPDKLELKASSTTIKNDGTSDAHIIVTVVDKEGNWLKNEPEVLLEVVDGPGVFPTGKTMKFKPGDSMRDGKAAIEFRSYYAGNTTIKASCPNNPDIASGEITITTVGEGSVEEPSIDSMYGSFMSNGGYVQDSIDEPTPYKYHSFKGCPTNASSGHNLAVNLGDGDYTTEWKAEKPGSNQWVYLEIEHGGINLYNARFTFKGKAYPFKIQYKAGNVTDGDWVTLKEYTADAIKNRPSEESFGGTYMRYIRVEFTDVPSNEYANLAEIELYGLRADTEGYAAGIRYLDSSENLSGTTDCELVYDLEKYDRKYARFQTDVVLKNTTLNSPVSLLVYCDRECVYEKKITKPSDICHIDVSINKVKLLTISATSADKNITFRLDNARLMGAYRDITPKQQSKNTITTLICKDAEVLNSDKEFTYEARFNNKKTSKVPISLATLVYSNDGTLTDINITPLTVSGKSTYVTDVKLPAILNCTLNDRIEVIAWNSNTLLPITDKMSIICNKKQGEGVKTNIAENASILSTIQEALGFIYANNADKYTTEARAGFTTTLLNAANILSNPDKTKNQLDAIEIELKKAISLLAGKGDSTDTDKDNDINKPVPTPPLNNQPPNNPTPSPSNSSLVKGKIYKSGKFRYKVLKTTNKASVALYAPVSKKMKSAVIPATVKINGKQCKVTEIANNAFMKCKNLKKVVIGKNIQVIGKKAFFKDKKLKKVVIKSKIIKKVAKNSFAGTSKKIRYSLPKSKKKAYKKLFVKKK